MPVFIVLLYVHLAGLLLDLLEPITSELSMLWSPRFQVEHHVLKLCFITPNLHALQ